MGRPELDRRAAAVNALVARVRAELPVLGGDVDLLGDRRPHYERALGLPKGALAWDRFEGEFAGWTVERIVTRLDRERSAPVPATTEGMVAAAMSPEDHLAETFTHLGLEPGQTLWLTGSPEVRRALEAAGATAPSLRSAPSQEQLRGFAVAVMCRGPVGHKVTNPWTRAIAKMPPHTGPTLIRATSSNISGIARSVYERRESLRPYVERWRSMAGGGEAR